MSQVKFKTEHKGMPVEVMAGWDRPLQGFFLTVFDLDENAEQECIYSNLDDCNLADSFGFSQSTDYFKQVLKSMEIGVPEEFWARVELREGNATHIFDGSWVRRG